MNKILTAVCLQTKMASQAGVKRGHVICLVFFKFILFIYSFFYLFIFCSFCLNSAELIFIRKQLLPGLSIIVSHFGLLILIGLLTRMLTMRNWDSILIL